MTCIGLVMVSVAMLASALVFALFRLAVLANQVGMLQDWAGEVTYELVAQEQALEVSLMRDRMQEIERELSDLQAESDSDSFPAEVA